MEPGLAECDEIINRIDPTAAGAGVESQGSGGPWSLSRCERNHPASALARVVGVNAPAGFLGWTRLHPVANHLHQVGEKTMLSETEQVADLRPTQRVGCLEGCVDLELIAGVGGFAVEGSIILTDVSEDTVGAPDAFDPENSIGV